MFFCVNKNKINSGFIMACLKRFNYVAGWYVIWKKGFYIPNNFSKKIKKKPISPTWTVNTLIYFRWFLGSHLAAISKKKKKTRLIIL